MDALWTAVMTAPDTEAAGEALQDLELWVLARSECTCNGLEVQACPVCRARAPFLEDDELPFEVK